jgi:hypothetical protein
LKYWDALVSHGPADFYGGEAAYRYAKAHRLGNKEARQDFLGFAEYGKEADIRIRREEEESASPPPAR